MRRVADSARIEKFLKAIGQEAEEEVRIYMTGGATAVLYGWRASTQDIDIKIVPESDRVSGPPTAERAGSQR